MYALLLMILLHVAGGSVPDSTRVHIPSPKAIPSVTVKIDTADRLAHALQRLKGTESQSSKSRYRIIHLLGGKLSARIPLSP